MFEVLTHLVARDPGKPADFTSNYYVYIPSLPPAIVALVIWLAITVAIVYRSYRFKIWYLTVMVVGLLSMILVKALTLVETIGYIMRVYGHFHLNAYNPYVTMQAFTVHDTRVDWLI
jgi:hypothetical protein